MRVLTEKSLRDDLDRGSVRMSGVASAGPVDLPAAFDAAFRAFDDGFFKVFVVCRP